MDTDAPVLPHDGPPQDGELPEGEETAPPGVHTMALVRWALVVLMALVAAGAVLYYFGVFEHARASTHATVYYCPMHPSVVQDHPGECPICSMTLVLKEGSAHAAAPEGATPARDMGHKVPGLSPVELTPERIQLLGMRTARVARESLIPEFRTVGAVTENEEGLAKIPVRFAGWIEQLMVSQTGQHVNRGQVLATVYSPELLTAEQEFVNARRWQAMPAPDGSQAHRMTSNLESDARRRLELLGISREEVSEIERTGEPLRALKIRSPVDGYVLRKAAVQGLYVQPGSPLFEIADLSTVWVIADVYESEVDRVRIGEVARFEPAAHPGKRFTGKVQFIYPTVNSDTRTLRVRLTFKNPGLALRPGMYGDVVVDLKKSEGLVVPTEAIVDTGVLQYAFVSLPGGRFEPRQVKIGARTRTKTEVLEGLLEGETVVTTANFLIDSESRLRAAIEGEGQSDGQGMTGGAAPAPSRQGQGPSCEADFDRQRFPEKYQACRACEIQHRGMGTMEEDCKNTIAKPWR